MTSAGPVKRNAPLLAASAGLRFALFPIPVITLFWKDQIGMSLTEIMWLQSIFGATAVVCEFPSGYVADRLGYRRSLVIGAGFWLAGWIAYALGATFAGIALAEILLGVGLAFISGADSALLYVSVEGGESSDRYRAWEGRVRATSQASEAASAAVGGWLYSIAPRLPFWLQIPVAAANLGVIAALYDVHPLEGATRTSHLRRAWHIVAHALVRHARLRASMALSVALGISTYIAVWLIQPWMQRRGIAPAWFGPLWAAAHLWLAAVSLANARVAQTLGVAPVLLGCSVLAGASYLALALGSSAVAVVFYLGFMTVRGLQGPLLAGALQADAPPEDRASVLSLNALLFRLAAAIVLPPVGALADRIGIEPTLGVLAALSLAVCLAAWSAFARAHRG
ncbi:MAG TPA: MFS transporter [Candidatus Binatia bacterium]|jgi:MFS family permease